MKGIIDMKKWFILFFVGCLIVTFAFADWQFRSASSHTFVSSLSWTNKGTAAVRLSALDTRFVSAATGTITVSRIRGSSTNIFQTYALTSATNWLATRAEFDGAWFILNDILFIENGSGITNTMILNLEVQKW